MKASSIETQIDIDEGNVLTAYPDPITKGDPWTIGRGHTGPEVHKGLVWTEEQSLKQRDIDIAKATAECKTAFWWFPVIEVPRQAVVIGMVYQMGLPRVKGFRKAWHALAVKEWDDVYHELLDSAWARQTPERAQRRAMQMRTGEWQ